MWKNRELEADQLSDEWFAARLGALTGSIVGDIMPGKSGKLPSWDKMMYKKAVEYMAGVDESKPIPEANADWGKFWEPYARSSYNEQKGIEMEEPGLIRSDFNDLVATSPDGITELGFIVLEIKCPMTMAKHLEYMHKSPALNLSSVALEKRYYWQCRHHMLCTGATSCDFVTYHDSFEPKTTHIVTVERDQAEMDIMQEYCNDFIKEMKLFAKNILSKEK